MTRRKKHSVYLGLGLGALAFGAFWFWGRRIREIPTVDPVTVKWVE